MKIKMNQTLVGASNSLGTASMDYVEGETYDMSQDWQESLGQVFIDNNFASDVGGGKKKKVDAPTETKSKAKATKK